MGIAIVNPVGNADFQKGEQVSRSATLVTDVETMHDVLLTYFIS